MTLAPARGRVAIDAEKPGWTSSRYGELEPSPSLDFVFQPGRGQIHAGISNSSVEDDRYTCEYRVPARKRRFTRVNIEFQQLQAEKPLAA